VLRPQRPKIRQPAAALGFHTTYGVAVSLELFIAHNDSPPLLAAEAAGAFGLPLAEGDSRAAAFSLYQGGDTRDKQQSRRATRSSS